LLTASSVSFTLTVAAEAQGDRRTDPGEVSCICICPCIGICRGFDSLAGDVDLDVDLDVDVDVHVDADFDLYRGSDLKRRGEREGRGAERRMRESLIGMREKWSV
jgi:hypothetical protein